MSEKEFESKVEEVISNPEGETEDVITEMVKDDYHGNHPKWHAFVQKRKAKKELKRQKEAAKSKLQVICEEIAFICIACICAIIIKNFIGQPILISGNSMNDTLNDKQLVWCNKIAYKPERFDVVIIHPDMGNEKMLIKRIIGLPGETVYIDENDKIHITPANGGEPYVLEDKYGYFKEPIYSRQIVCVGNVGGSITLGKDEYFCLGDNRYNSGDSRSYGPFSREKISGHAVTRIWPLNKIGDFDKSNE